MLGAGSVFERLRIWHLLLILALLYGILGIYNILPLRPQSVHQWAQCDRASVAWNYYKGYADFFHPRVNNTDNGTGITGLEFPIVQYFVSILYRLFGFHEWLYRLTTLVVFTASAVAVFRLANYFLKDKLPSLMVMVMYVCSPLLTFYSCSFIPDIYSLSFAMIAWSLLIRYIDSPSVAVLWRWFIAMSLACLIKPNSMINLPVMWLFLYRNQLWTWQKPFRFIGFFVAIAGLSITWYTYASWLSKTYQSEVFLLEMRPPKSWQEVQDVWTRVSEDWLERIYKKKILILLLMAGIAGLIVNRPNKNHLASYTLLMVICSLSFLYVMFLQLSYHDYYFITMFPSIVFLLIFIMYGFKTRLGEMGVHISVIVLLFFIFSQAHFTRGILRFAHEKSSWMYGSPQNDVYFDAEQILSSAGIGPDDQVISVFDHSPNISLYLMGRKGVAIPYRNVSETLNSYLHTGRYKYVIFNSYSVKDIEFKPEDFPLVKVVDMNGVRIFNVSSSFHPDGRTTPISPWN